MVLLLLLWRLGGAGVHETSETTRSAGAARRSRDLSAGPSPGPVVIVVPRIRGSAELVRRRCGGARADVGGAGGDHDQRDPHHQVDGVRRGARVDQQLAQQGPPGPGGGGDEVGDEPGEGCPPQHAGSVVRSAHDEPGEQDQDDGGEQGPQHHRRGRAAGREGEKDSGDPRHQGPEGECDGESRDPGEVHRWSQHSFRSSCPARGACHRADLRKPPVTRAARVFGPGDRALLLDGTPVAPLAVAETARARRRGLLGTDRVVGALWITRCPSVHMVGMRYPIDVAVVDREGRVLHVATLRRLTGMTRFRLRASATIEAAAGSMTAWGVRRGSVLTIGETAP
ncbi:hypothetical protein GHK92_10685 [Nocardioides sp. dk4132]|nr:hypothetical protein [Nocardioides sp. dk4132]QGA07378.1 hypothetical protein GFH29_08235 [Nocardioides sp. dk884]